MLEIPLSDRPASYIDEDLSLLDANRRASHMCRVLFQSVLESERDWMRSYAPKTGAVW